MGSLTDHLCLRDRGQRQAQQGMAKEQPDRQGKDRKDSARAQAMCANNAQGEVADRRKGSGEPLYGRLLGAHCVPGARV